MNKKNISTFTFSAVFFLIAACIVLYPKEAFTAAADGLTLWFNVVCPALLPFFICVEILTGLGIVSFFGSVFKPLMRPVFRVPGEGSFSFFMSISSGYPVGASITARLRQAKLCTSVEGQRMLGLCSTSGPLFIIGAVATGIMKDSSLGFLLAAAHYLSAITIGLLMRCYGRENGIIKNSHPSNPVSDMLDYRKKDGRPFGMLMGDSVKGSVNLILMIGGFIIFFSVITSTLKISGFLRLFSAALSGMFPSGAITPDMVSSFLIGFMEVTNGAKACASLQAPLISKTVLISFMIGFGGLSVNAQVMSIISGTDLKFGIYFIFKLLQGIIASLYSFILFTFFYDLQVFNINAIAETGLFSSFTSRSPLKIFTDSVLNLMLLLAAMLLASVFVHIKRLLSKKPFCKC